MLELKYPTQERVGYIIQRFLLVQLETSMYRTTLILQFLRVFLHPNKTKNERKKEHISEDIYSPYFQHMSMK